PPQRGDQLVLHVRGLLDLAHPPERDDRPRQRQLADGQVTGDLAAQRAGQQVVADEVIAGGKHSDGQRTAPIGELYCRIAARGSAGSPYRRSSVSAQLSRRGNSRRYTPSGTPISLQSAILMAVVCATTSTRPPGEAAAMSRSAAVNRSAAAAGSSPPGSGCLPGSASKAARASGKLSRIAAAVGPSS